MFKVASPLPHRRKIAFELTGAQAKEIKQRMLNWAKQYSILIFLDSNNYPSGYNGYECLLAAGAADTIGGSEKDTLSRLQQRHDENPDWLFGHICYDHKNVIEPRLTSAHQLRIGFPEVHFFIPETVCHLNREQTTLTIESFDDPNTIYKDISSSDVEAAGKTIPKLQFSYAVDQERYIDAVKRLRSHIADGDCYEINFCAEACCDHADIDPLLIFNALNALSPAPFAAYYRLNDRYMMCASPERYLKKEGSRLLSQPIKGTARRDKEAAKDSEIREALRSNLKERAENVMIVDLVRNDLARCCETGSVRVDELFGIYTFPQVHQMISTVSGSLRPGLPFTDAIRYSFPMGSMTGAPKFKVMQLIEEYERSRRELYSGTVGYITPEGDFDFNVVIRSLFYTAADKYLSFQTGGAITYDSDPISEWEEMRLKAWALERIFQ
jgi:para-aminobenzoate synthetase component I